MKEMMLTSKRKNQYKANVCPTCGRFAPEYNGKKIWEGERKLV